MLAEERLSRIMKLLSQQRTATVQELCEALDASESTIRRDLNELDRMGKVNKVHGGATLPDSQFLADEPTMAAKEALAVAQKKCIAKAAAALITAEDFVFLDAGSTTLALVRELSGPALDARYVTNGVHVPSYTGAPMRALLDNVLGPGWQEQSPDSSIWSKIDEIPDEGLWAVRQLQKKQLLDYLRASLPEFFKKFAIPYEKQKEMAACLTPSSLVIGFARRFAPYKRATLLFADLDRLARIVGNAERPVIFVFSGKAHPADTQGIDMLQEVIRHMLDPRFFGKIFFIEDYNLAVSRLMVQGCDVWLNTPRRPYEACGTSGQKVPVNAGVNLSISDGWWCEGYNGENGWTIGPAVTREYLCGEQSDYDDAGFLYALLEEKIVPLYFERNFEGMPHDWLLTVRQSMQSLIARFSSNRMVREYLNDYYIPAAQRYAELRDKHNALTKRLARWKQDVNARFSSLRIEQIRIEGLKGEELMGTQPMQVQIGVLPGGMKPEELLVQLVAGPGDGNGFTDTPDVVDMARTEESTADRLVYACAYSPSRSGPHVYGVRVLPVTPGLASPLETRLVLWG